MIRYRRFRNIDPPALAALWNRAIPTTGSVRPIRVHELDDHAFGSVYFEAEGLIVAESDGRIAGYVHAGFGPDQPVEQTAPFALGQGLGTIAMLLIEPGQEDPALARGLILEAERYLRRRGAEVLYAGGQFPLNPFYWGLYAGSEGAGILSRHDRFTVAVMDMGYEPVGTTVLLETDLNAPELRDPRSTAIRRLTLVEAREEAMPVHWWQNLAIGESHLTRLSLVSRADQAVLARATTWDMSRFGREDGRSRIGLVDLEVMPEHRRKGYGRLLVSEILAQARDRGASVATVQTSAENEPALALYTSLGFEPVDESSLFRLPAPLTKRSDPR